MRVLVACEESQEVCKAFRALGHSAYSCDILPCSGGHPEWHIQGDVLPLLDGWCRFDTMDGRKHMLRDWWDLMIAFPPCTHLAVSGAAWFKEKRKDGRQQQGIDFFMKMINASCDKIAVENPVGIMSTHYRKPDQIIHPWMFGDPYSKSTCLWLKGLPKLIPYTTQNPELEYFEWTDKKSGRKKRENLWIKEARNLSPEERARVRSKTFPGIAKAMAEQWGKNTINEEDL